MKREATVILAIAVIALLIGQIVSYYGSSSDFSISTSEDGGTIDYTVRSGPDVEYTELHLDNGVKAPTKFYVLRDDSYPISADRSSIGPTSYFLESAFDKCRSISMEYRNVQEILEMMDDDLITGTPDTGIIILGGALPQPWYDGTISSRIIQWMNIGGSVYWGGDLFGRYISTPDGIVTVEDYHTSVCNSLFGTEHLFNESDSDVFGDERINPELTELSGMYYANIRFGTDVNKITVPYTALGYTDGQYASATIMKYGSGSLCVFGSYVNFQITEYMVHVLLLGLTYSTSIVDSHTGSIKDGSHSGSFEESLGISHFVILRDVRWHRAWAYDGSEKTFV